MRLDCLDLTDITILGNHCLTQTKKHKITL